MVYVGIHVKRIAMDLRETVESKAEFFFFSEWQNKEPSCWSWMDGLSLSCFEELYKTLEEKGEVLAGRVFTSQLWRQFEKTSDVLAAAGERRGARRKAKDGREQGGSLFSNMGCLSGSGRSDRRGDAQNRRLARKKMGRRFGERSRG
jgi:hypothetical protein